MPKVRLENKAIVTIYQVLSTLAVEPATGLVKFDLPLIRSLCDLFQVDEEGRDRASGLLLFMIMESTNIRVRKRLEERKKEDAKRDRDKFKREIGRKR